MSHLQILIVDDDQDFAESLAEALGLSGWRAETAFGAEEALRKVEREAFDVALVDVVMPGIDGVVCLDRILALRPNTRIGIMTGFTVPDRIERALELGAASVVQKPIDTQVLIGLLSGICQAPVALLGIAEPTAQRRLKSEMERLGFNVVTATSTQALRAEQQAPAVGLAVIDGALLAGSDMETLAALLDGFGSRPAVLMASGCVSQDAPLMAAAGSRPLVRVLLNSLSERGIAREVQQFFQGLRAHGQA